MRGISNFETKEFRQLPPALRNAFIAYCLLLSSCIFNEDPVSAKVKDTPDTGFVTDMNNQDQGSDMNKDQKDMNMVPDMKKDMTIIIDMDEGDMGMKEDMPKETDMEVDMETTPCIDKNDSRLADIIAEFNSATSLAKQDLTPIEPTISKVARPGAARCKVGIVEGSTKVGPLEDMFGEATTKKKSLGFDCSGENYAGDLALREELSVDIDGSGLILEGREISEDFRTFTLSGSQTLRHDWKLGVTISGSSNDYKVIGLNSNIHAFNKSNGAHYKYNRTVDPLNGSWEKQPYEVCKDFIENDIILPKTNIE